MTDDTLTTLIEQAVAVANGTASAPDKAVAIRSLIDVLIARVRAETAHALAESVKLQAHYAELLNMHDGGQRLIFPTVDAWLERLKVS